MSETADFIIVGAGVYGCATALALAERGAAVTVLEKGEIASGASGGLGKRGVRANARDPRELPLMRDAYALWPELDARLGQATGYERTGHLLVFERERDRPVAHARALAQGELGIESTVIEADAAREIEPHLGPAAIGAVRVPLDGVADHTATTRAFAAAARRAGAEIREHCAVEGVEVNQGRVAAVRLEDQSTLSARRGVVLLANAHTPELLRAAIGLELPVWPVLPQVMRTEAMEDTLVRGLVGHAHRVLSMKAMPGGGVMISGGWRGTWNAAARRGEATADQIDGNWAEALAVFPVLKGHRIEAVSAERLESTSIDGIPIIDRAPGIEGLTYACGWCGHGWAIAPAIAPRLAEWLLDGRRPEILAPFSHARFKA